MKKINGKKLGLLLRSLSIILIISFLVLFIISFHSDELISNQKRLIVISLLIFSFALLIFSFYLLNKNRHVVNYRKWLINIFNSLVILYVVGCSGVLLLLYGPYEGFKNWLITTAMGTMHHQYLCKWFYDNETIKAVKSNNYVEEFKTSTDSSLVEFPVDYPEEENFEKLNNYEKQILSHRKDDAYKLINLTVNDCNAYLIAVYDPSRISLVVSKWLGKSGQYVYDMGKENNALVAINGGGFIDPGANTKGENPLGVTIKDGNVISNHPNGYLIGFNYDNVLLLTKNEGAEKALQDGYRDCVTMGPLLIVNGEKAVIKGNGGWGYAARTAIGQRKDGIVLMLIVDSNEFRSKGASMVDLTEIMYQYGAINAANLDGGTSSVIAINGTMINDPIDSALRHRTRGVPTAWIVK